MGTNEIGSLQPMINMLGSRQRNAITSPFHIGCSFKLEVANINPATTQRKNADRLASQVKPCITIGITSSTPIKILRSKPITMLFYIFIFIITLFFFYSFCRPTDELYGVPCMGCEASTLRVERGLLECKRDGSTAGMVPFV